MNANALSTNEYSSHIVFITGGTKSGKSEFAEYLAKKVKKLSYVALSENNLDDKEYEEWSTKLYSLINLLINRKSITFIVGEQVGWSLVSEYKIGNTYIERIGELQKRITKISKDNWLAINGRAIKIDEISIEIPT